MRASHAYLEGRESVGLARRVRRWAAGIFEIRFRPGSDTALAISSAVAFTFVYYFGSHSEDPLSTFLVFTVFGPGLLCVIFPALYVLVVRGEPLENLGITTRRWPLALALSALFAVGSLPQLLIVAENVPNLDLTAHLMVNGLLLWEPFFVYGWLQMRFERAFGILPGIFLAALCFAGYHLGTFPPVTLAGFFVVAVVQAVLFRAVGASLLVLWPLTAAVGSSIGTLQGGFAFDWSYAPGAVFLLLAQIAAIAVFARWSGRDRSRTHRERKGGSWIT